VCPLRHSVGPQPLGILRHATEKAVQSQAASSRSGLMMRVKTDRILVAAMAGTLLACGAGLAVAGAREQAQRIHDRIAGVPPSAQVLDQMEQLVAGGDAAGAARVAMLAPSFYTTTLKNWITPWTNREQSVFAPLNDYTATVIGIIRDDVDYRQVLMGDI